MLTVNFDLKGIFIPTLVFGFAVSVSPSGQVQVQLPSEPACFLEPMVSAEVFTAKGQRIDPFAASQRVHERFRKESAKWPNWKLKWVDTKSTVDVQRQVFGERSTQLNTLVPSKLKQLADGLGCRYVVSYRLKELVGNRTSGFGARTTGVASVEVFVFDAQTNGFVWTSSIKETSSVFGTTSAIQNRVDQAYINTLQKALEPFATQGLTKRLKISGG